MELEDVNPNRPMAPNTQEKFRSGTRGDVIYLLDVIDVEAGMRLNPENWTEQACNMFARLAKTKETGEVETTTIF